MPRPRPTALYPCLLLPLALAWPQSAGTPAPARRDTGRTETSIAAGVTYTHVRQTTPAGEPLSIHVLEIDRGAKSAEVRAVRAQPSENGMQRELPTAMAAREQSRGLQVIAVVNGDYDLGGAHLGVPDGLSVTDGRLHTTGKPGWPLMAILRSNQPVIAVPEVDLQLEARGKRIRIGALNKPFGSTYGPDPRAYTADYRPQLKSETPFRAVIIKRLSPGLPLAVNRAAQGTVREVIADATELTIPPDTLVLAERIPPPTGAETTSKTAGQLSRLRAGDRVKLRASVRVAGRSDLRDAVGGFPILVQNGRRDIIGTPSDYLALRHPRTATCYNDRKIFFVVVDGRRPQLSMGMTLEELADWMVSLECQVALNTDGGGSSVMAVALPKKDGAQRAAPLEIVNSPSDGRERGRGNAWLILHKR